MRKLICFSSIILVLFLSSCIGEINRKTNILFECDLKTETDGKTYFLNVETICETEFNQAKGLNVVEDVTQKEGYRFYYIKLFTFENNIEFQYNFLNLKEKYPKNNKIPSVYEDDNGNALSTAYSTKYPKNNRYTITYNNLYLVFGGDNSSV